MPWVLPGAIPIVQCRAAAKTFRTVALSCLNQMLRPASPLAALAGKKRSLITSIGALSQKLRNAPV